MVNGKLLMVNEKNLDNFWNHLIQYQFKYFIKNEDTMRLSLTIYH